MNGNKEAMWNFFNKSHQKRSKWEKEIQEAYVANEAAGV